MDTRMCLVDMFDRYIDGSIDMMTNKRHVRYHFVRGLLQIVGN